MNSGKEPVFRIMVTRLATQLPTFGVQSPIQSAPPLPEIFFSIFDCSGSVWLSSLALRNAGAYGSVQYLAPTNGFSPCFQGASGGVAGSGGRAAGASAAGAPAGAAAVEVAAGAGSGAAAAAFIGLVGANGPTHAADARMNIERAKMEAKRGLRGVMCMADHLARKRRCRQDAGGGS